MGGKNKKHKAPGAAAVRAAVSASRAKSAEAGADAETQSKKPGARPPPAAAAITREPRVKQGPKIYSFNSANDSGGPANLDKSILKVVINNKLEQRIIGVINEHKKQNIDKGVISGRLTAKKLQDLYMALQAFSFKTKDIEDAMTNTLLHGGDLHSALDWLCLNLSDDALPEGFSQEFEEPQPKSRAKFQSPQIQATITPPLQIKTKKQEEDHKIKTKKEEKPMEVNMKEWILRYAEQQNEEDKSENSKSLEEEKKFDPNERYLTLAAKLLDAKEQAATFKLEKNKQGQREAQEKIRKFQREMETLEDHPVFNPAIKVSHQQNERKKPSIATEGESALNFNLFEKSAAAMEEEKDKKKESHDVRNFDYTARSWTGKSPKQFLIDWVRKNLPKSPNPSFEKVPVGRYWKCRVRVIKSDDDVLVVCPTILTEDGMQAQHLGATLALYRLVKGQNVLCGYQIRMESRASESTRLLYCTTGVLLRKLQEDGLLTNVSHVIVDEVHERSVQSDFLLVILKEILQKRSDLHLILMSATVDSEKFSTYFTHCPILRISGRSYPVEVFHLEDIIEETGFVLEKDSEYCQKFLEEEEEITLNVTGKAGGIKKYHEHIPVYTGTSADLNPFYQKYSNRTQHAISYMNPHKINLDLILELLVYLDKSPQFRNIEGAVLIFLPGLAHIQQLYDLLSNDRRFYSERYKVIALHSILSTQDQAAAFTLPPPGVRKIVLATNIAETGITIPDVVFVIDTGRTKENKYHESSQMSSLVETFVSKASALQRQGRAGRVRDGFCFRLYTRERFEGFMDYSVPEILRVPLEELCLHIMKCNLGSPEDFLSKALDPPQLQVISNAMNLLRKIGACELNEPKLTPLGQHLAALPVNVKIGKMLIFGAIFGCLNPVATLAAVMTEKSPFTTPIGRKDEADLAKSALAMADSDHLTIYNAYLGWKKARQEGGYRSEIMYCRRNFLNRTSLLTLEDVKQELIKLVKAAGFSSASTSTSWEENRASQTLSFQEIALLKAVLAAGLYDNVGKIIYTKSVDVTEKLACIVETAQGKAQVHPSSVNRDLQTHGWLLYQEKIRYARVYLRETTLITPFPVLLFGGDIEVQHRERLLSVDGWIYFQAPVKIAVIFKQLRILIDSVLRKKLENPKMSLENDKILQIITELIKTENSNGY
ncbi:ATP-dependent RNA helicase DHX29 isoform X2 [Marmota marmota marmota]|uniref:ATP-dependent RNA helicase DHX29 isoform X2 n=1 Tax=Marmota marmota marmota TaxID=9994 RepID=UPI002093B7A1|nr:ATP-dependent RNA helicase DHX29 isoform X2 [Marmota marmota marmota]